MNRLTRLCLLLLSALTMMSCAAKNSNKTEDSETSESRKSEVMKPIEITAEQFAALIVKYDEPNAEWKYLGDRPCIVDFYATWCGPCKMVAPILEELAGKYGDEIYVYKVDVDKERELANAFGIRSIPTLLFIPQEGDPQMMAGAMSKQELENIIESVLKVRL